MKVLTAAQIREWDQFTIENEPIASIDLIERAAMSCTRWLIQSGFHSHIMIFCGKGNNGGDGLAIARQLAEKDIHADVYILEFGVLGTSDFQINLSRLHDYPVAVHYIQHADAFPIINDKDVVIDALYGSGVNRPLEGLSAQLVQHINDSNSTIISIDMPSGLFADRSTILHPVVKADYTLTFQILKLAFLFPENESFLGKVVVLDIGLHPDFSDQVNSKYELSDIDLAKKIYKPRLPFSHKGTYGHALMIAGSKGKMGAATLATKACLRSGAGLVTSMIPSEEMSIIQLAAPEAMATAQEDLPRINLDVHAAIGIGPGLGTDHIAHQLVSYLLNNYHKPIVFDADALNILCMNKDWYKKIPAESILTPHPKEYERLFEKTASNYDRLQQALQLAAALHIYIIIKGKYSMLACPNGEVYFNGTGNPGMATGGSGDVLTGIITGLLAQQYSPKEAAILALYIHGLAGDFAAVALSQEAMLAGDIIDYLGKAFLTVKG